MKYRIVIAPELIAEGRRLYEETDTPVRVIAKRMGLTRSTLNYRIADWKWVRRHASAADPPLIQELPAAAAAAPPSAADPPAELPAPNAAPPSEPPPLEPPLPFAERFRRVIDIQMQVAERTLKVLGPTNSAEAERTGRILALVSRTVQEIKATAEGRADEADNDAAPGDIDEFREELARRIRGFIEARAGSSSGGDGGPAGDDERRGT